MAEKVSSKPQKVNFGSDQDVRWCPGCGDYAILSQMKKVLPELGIPKEKVVFISGIGCNGRFPYYLSTYGFHTLHGRAPIVASGVKLANPELSVWVITGDGDSLSIGGNHLMHLIRRNMNINIILINNQIYGLTKGQYSPTSPLGKVTKTTPYGSLDRPVNPLSLVLSAGATFVARTIDRDTKHMAQTFREAAAHNGCSFVEVFQNCNIFNDGAFQQLTDPKTKQEKLVYLQHGEPLVYGAEKDKGLRLNGFEAEHVALENEQDREGLIVHDESQSSDVYSYMLSRMTENPALPTPVGVIRRVAHDTYNDNFVRQIDAVKQKKGKGNLKQLLISGDTWSVD